MRTTITRYGAVVGLPEDGRAIVISNSERNDAACDHRWWLRHVEGLRPAPYPEQAYGTAWHAVMESADRWWMTRDEPLPDDWLDLCLECPRDPNVPCVACGDTSMGIIERLHVAAVNLAEQLPIERRPPREELDADSVRLRRAAEGWVRRWGKGPSETHAVVGVEVQLAREIRNPWTGGTYRPETIVIAESDGSMRLATTGEASDKRARVVTWPWYQVGTLDSILRARQHGALVVGERKSSASPRTLSDGLAIDPQTVGYSWLLEPHLERFGGTKLGGLIFDVASSSMQHDPEPLKWRPPTVEVLKQMAVERGIDPKPLKSSAALCAALGIVETHGGFSRAKHGAPSWRYEAAVRAAGLDVADYAEHLAMLRSTIDASLYQREQALASKEAVARYAAEVYADAVRFAAMRRAAARAENATDVAVAFPRTAVCRIPGARCAYRHPCLSDGEEARRSYERDLGQRWTVDVAPTADPAQIDLW